MTKSLRYSILLLAALSLAVISCEDQAIPSDKLGTDSIQQGKTPGPHELLNETFYEDQGRFAIIDKKAASAAVWTHIKSGSTQGYMVASASINGKIEQAESWLVSPVMDLTCYPKGVQLTFRHYYVGDPSQRNELMQIVVSTDAGKSWKQIKLEDEAMWSNGKRKYPVDATIDLAEYVTAQTQVAFAYKSTADAAPTWAIQNVRVGEPKEE